jgi:predicted RNA binding protein YcfA (HicA-like mRNA interferase family)
VRQKGSHRIYVKGNIGITIPYHNKDLKKGTLRAIIKQSGLSVEEFLKLLRKN